MLARALIALIRVYQLTLSKLIRATLGNVCRFEPSCSRYAVACIQGHGALRGSLLSAKRLCRCHPFHPGGYDPPPPPRENARAFPVVSLSVGAHVPAGVLSAAAHVPAGEVPSPPHHAGDRDGSAAHVGRVSASAPARTDNADEQAGEQSTKRLMG